MFLRRQKRQREERSSKDESPKLPGAERIPRHLGDVWQLLQTLAREEDPKFAEKSVVEHFNSCAEGARDVERWLHAYLRRLNPSYPYEFPAHFQRHRGHVLAARNWPEGVTWDAFDERTLLRAPLPPAANATALTAALDHHLDEAADHRGGDPSAKQ